MDSGSQRRAFLVIMDGWGYGNHDRSNGVELADTPVFDRLLATYPHSTLQASGISVGLPKGQMGNSEVGHMNLGAGRVIYQDLVRINQSIEHHTLSTNPELIQAIEHTRIHHTSLHLVGLLSDGGVHSHLDHVKALTEIAAGKGLNKVYIHGFTDGRDTDPTGGVGYVADLEGHLAKTTGELCSLIGRYYAMDRDNRWERVQKAYALLVEGRGRPTESLLDSLRATYAEGITDEFVLPLVKTDSSGKPIGTIKAGDTVLFFNYRTDRCRELTSCLTQTAYPAYQMKPIEVYFVTMTTYDQAFKGIHVLFEKDNLSRTLGEVVSSHHKRQIRIAETEKYPHVTFFFSGGRETPFTGEKRILIPSPSVATYDLKPEMSAFELVEAILPEIRSKEADLICLNFANPDMVGHTGNLSAVIRAVETVDQCMGEVVTAGLENGYSMILLADHGNAEYMVNNDGSPNTAHTTNGVPCILIAPGYHSIREGKLADIAPTLLTLMGLPIPVEMTGEVLIS